MRNEIEKLLDEVWGSMRYDSEEATDKILALLEGSLPKARSLEDLLETYKSLKENGSEELLSTFTAYANGWNACREAMLDNLKEKGEQ